MKRKIAAIAALFAFGVGAPTLIHADRADAHIVTTAQDDIYVTINPFWNHCGNGLLWQCSNHLSYGYAYYVGAHSRRTSVAWREVYMPSLNPRTCGVEGRVEHGALVQIYVGEHCWG